MLCSMKCSDINSGLRGKGNTPPDLFSGIRLEELRNAMENINRDRNYQDDCLIILFSGVPTETAHTNPYQLHIETLS